MNTQSNLKVLALNTSLLLYKVVTIYISDKHISPEGGLNLTVCSSLHKTDWEAKPDQSVLIFKRTFSVAFHSWLEIGIKVALELLSIPKISKTLLFLARFSYQKNKKNISIYFPFFFAFQKIDQKLFLHSKRKYF